MEIIATEHVLRQHGFRMPDLEVLRPTVSNYSVALLQPEGKIVASSSGVRHLDEELGRKQFQAFLVHVDAYNFDLAVTPEYSTPWVVLKEELLNAIRPAAGKLWVLGCESLTLPELDQLRSDLRPEVEVIFEDLPHQPGRFLDPLVYVFETEREIDAARQVVMLVQFKTHPMGDPDHFEVNNLQLGTRVYRFVNAGSLSLLSLICSDAFAFTDAAVQQTYDRALLIHIQLNQSPRQHRYRAYRDRLFGLAGDATEVICLNWATTVVECCGDEEKPWRHVPLSAWYLRPDRFDSRDTTLAENHKRGMYYTWIYPLQTHALIFNFGAALFELIATKVSHIGVPAVLSRRRGPQLTARRTWDYESARWSDPVDADDGFAATLLDSGGAQPDLALLTTQNPFAVERLVTLATGRAGASHAWHELKNVESCRIDASEVIRRVTFGQDTEPSAATYRRERMRRCAALWDILSAGEPLPLSMADLREEFHFVWSAENPHQNIVGPSGPATAVYLGESSEPEIAEVHARLSEFLHRSAPNPELAVRSRQRLAVYARDAHGVTVVPIDKFVQIDEPLTESAFDITRKA